MKVLLLTWEFPPGTIGGRAAHVDGLAHALARLGHDVVVLTRREAGTDPDNVVGAVRILRADIDLPWLESGRMATTASANHHLVAITARLGAWRPDIVHANDWDVAWAADSLAQLHDCPLITTFHGTARGRHGGHIPPGDPVDINNVEWWLAFRSQRVIATTALLGREIVEGFEYDHDRLVHIPAGIDPTWWQSTGADETLRARTGLVFSWGRVQYEKGFQILARAMGLLAHRVDGVHAIIAGRGSYLPELQSQIDLAQASHLIDLPGFVTEHELREFVHNAACVVVPSLYEPFGVVALEAMAGGAPLIVSDTGGLAELVRGSQAALTFEPGNADELADRIEQVLTHPELAADLTRRGRAMLAKRYTWPAIAARTVDVYESVRS